MNTRWELVVNLARQMKATLARGKRPDDSSVERLVRGVLEFQEFLIGAEEDTADARIRWLLR
ncbi:MAG TPA: hypothetical protein VF765_27540 [Polyangiaceae bacterium]